MDPARFQNDRFGFAAAVERAAALARLGGAEWAADDVGGAGPPAPRSRLVRGLRWRAEVLREAVARRRAKARAASRSAKPRVLYLIPYDAIRPVIGGSVRTHELGRLLAAEFRVTIVTIAGPRQDEQVLPLAPDLNLAIFPVSQAMSDEIEHNRVRMKNAAWSVELQRRGAEIPNLAAYLRSARDRLACLLISGPFLYPCVEQLAPEVPVVYETIDVATDFLRMVAGSADISAEVRETEEIERRLIAKAAAVVCVSEHDRDEMVKRFGADRGNFRLVPNGVNVRRRLFVEPGRSRRHREECGIPRPVVLFLGSAMEANLKAAQFIAGELAPALPQALFVAAGLGGDELAGPAPENMVFTGAVMDSGLLKEALFLLSEVAIAPMTLGTGSSLKIPDYLAHGKAVVSTELGVRGHDAMKPFVTIAPMDQFRAAVSGVLADLETTPSCFDARGRDGRARVAETLDWSVVAEPLVRELRAQAKRGTP